VIKFKEEVFHVSLSRTWLAKHLAFTKHAALLNVAFDAVTCATGPRFYAKQFHNTQRYFIDRYLPRRVVGDLLRLRYQLIDALCHRYLLW